MLGVGIVRVKLNPYRAESRIHVIAFADRLFGNSVMLWQPVHLSMLSWNFFTSTPYNILFNPLAAFPHNSCVYNGQLSEKMFSLTMISTNPPWENVMSQ